MKNIFLIVAILIIVVLGSIYFLSRDNTSSVLLAEINQKGLQKFIDDHNISDDDILFNKVCPLIETGNEEWIKIGADMYYADVVTHNAGFNEVVGQCLGYALDTNPDAVFNIIKNHDQVQYNHSRLDEKVILSKQKMTAIGVIKDICSRTIYDFDDSEPRSAVMDLTAKELLKRKNMVEKVNDHSVSDLKNACLSELQ